MKYRTKRTLIRAVFLALMSLLLFSFFNNNTTHKNTCYSIITDGKRAKYVYFITTLLQEQGVDKNDIYILHDRGLNKQEFMNNFNHRVLKNTKNSLTTVYKTAFETLFEKENCEYAVMLEDDIFPGADAVAYFEWGRRVMDNDPLVLSVSGSHDNAGSTLSLNPQVFVKTEQLVDLGWLTSKRFHDKVFKNLDTTSKIPWNKQVNDMMNVFSFVSVFPHLPRTFHLSHTSELQVSTNSEYRGEYVPVNIFNDYGDGYVKWLNGHFPTEKRVVRSFRQLERDMRGKVAWPISNLSNKPFGYYNGMVIYPTNDPTGKLLIVYKSK